MNKLGCSIFTNPQGPITDILTPSALRSMQDADTLIEEKLWPCLDPADMGAGKSTLSRPEDLPTIP